MVPTTNPAPLVQPWVPPASAYSPFFTLGSAATVHGRFEEIAARHGDTPAVTSDGGNWSYSRLNQEANRVAWLLLRAGLQLGDRVALVAGHHPGAVAAHLGISKAGGAVVPLDPQSPPAQLTPFLQHSRPRFVFTEPHYLPAVTRAAESTGTPILTLANAASEPENNPERAVAPHDLYVIIYSSGTTGLPKGVQLTHEQRCLQSGHYADALGIGRGDRWSFLHHLHSAGSLADFVSALLTGATLAMYDAQARGLADMADWARRERLTVFHWIPSGFRGFVATLPPHERFDGLRMVLVGSEPALSSDLAAFQRHFARPGHFVNRYAAAEAGCGCLYVTDHDTPVSTGVLPAGKVVPAWKMAVVDESGRPVAAGETGTIAIRSTFNSSGYWNRPDLTEQAFRAVPGSPERVWLSGDLGRFEADGTLIHLGRSDSIVKIRGRKVSLLEVEAVLLEHPGVAEAAVIACPAPAGDSRIVAYFVPRSEASPSIAAVRDWVAARLPSHAVPERCIPLPAFPRTRTGKLDRRALPDPGRERPALDAPFEAPEGPTEEALAAIWVEVLHLDQVGRRDPFLDLGGTSLVAAQIAARISHQWDARVTPAEVFGAKTVAVLAELVFNRLAGGLDAGLFDELLMADRAADR